MVTVENKPRATSAGRLPASAPPRRSSATADRTCPAAPPAFSVHRDRPPQVQRRNPRPPEVPSTSPTTGTNITPGFPRTPQTTHPALDYAISGYDTYPPLPPAPTMGPDTSQIHISDIGKDSHRVDLQGKRPPLSFLKVEARCMHAQPEYPRVFYRSPTSAPTFKSSNIRAPPSLFPRDFLRFTNIE
ncbi:hypothetical protein GGG16DRAFT_119531 [Schizophyllum commune]